MTEFDTTIDTKPKVVEKPVEKPTVKSSETPHDAKKPAEKVTVTSTHAMGTQEMKSAPKAEIPPPKDQEKASSELTKSSGAGKVSERPSERSSATSQSTETKGATQKESAEAETPAQQAGEAKTAAGAESSASSLEEKRAHRAQRFGIPVVTATQASGASLKAGKLKVVSVNDEARQVKHSDHFVITQVTLPQGETRSSKTSIRNEYCRQHREGAR